MKSGWGFCSGDGDRRSLKRDVVHGDFVGSIVLNMESIERSNTKPRLQLYFD
jgi:hypothetical protein